MGQPTRSCILLRLSAALHDRGADRLQRRAELAVGVVEPGHERRHNQRRSPFRCMQVNLSAEPLSELIDPPAHLSGPSQLALVTPSPQRGRSAVNFLEHVHHREVFDLVDLCVSASRRGTSSCLNQQ
jgi:hypothetical protein